MRGLLRACRAGWVTVALGLWPALAPSAAGKPRPESSDPVELPALVVVDERSGPVWQFLVLPDCEILAACSAGNTEVFGEDMIRQRNLLSLLAPDEFIGHFARPAVCVLFDKASAQAMPPELVETATQGKPLLYVAPGGDARIGRDLDTLASRLRFQLAPNLFVFGTDSCGIAIELGSKGGPAWNGFQRSDGVRMRMSASFVSALLRLRSPALPEWYVDATRYLWVESRSAGDALWFLPMDWKDQKGRRPNVRDPETLTRLSPAEFCAPAAADLSPDERLALTRHRALLMRWSLAQPDERRREAFWQLVRRSIKEPVTAELVRECYGLDDAAMRRELNRALINAQKNSESLRPPKSRVVKTPASRPASLIESARLLGEWQRLAANYIQEESAVRQRYFDEARRNLRRPLDKGMRDPEALGLLALVEFDSGNREVAFPLLEEALRAGNTRQDLLLTLATCRLRAAQEQPKGEAGRLSALQSREVLELLRMLQEAPAPQQGVFELYATVCLLGETDQPAELVPAIRRGLELYPNDLRLLERGTDALARAKELVLARELVTSAIPRFQKPADREALELRLQRLESESLGR